MDLQRRLEQLERDVAALRGGERRGEISLTGLGRRLERCKLTADLAAGGTAAAVLVDGNDAATTLAITVTDQDSRGPLETDQILTIWWRETPGGAEPGIWIPFDVGCCDTCTPRGFCLGCCTCVYDVMQMTFVDDLGISNRHCVDCSALIDTFLLDIDPIACVWRYSGSICNCDASYGSAISFSAELTVYDAGGYCPWRLDLMFGNAERCTIFPTTVRYETTQLEPENCGAERTLDFVFGGTGPFGHCDNWPSQVTIGKAA